MIRLFIMAIKAELPILSIAPKIHSEIAAYRKAKGILTKNEPFEIVNIRLNKNKELRLSKPCICCFEIMKELGCSKFYFSSNAGFLKIIT